MFKRMHVAVTVDGDTFEIEMATKAATDIRRFARQMEIAPCEYLVRVIASEWHAPIEGIEDAQGAPRHP